MRAQLVAILAVTAGIAACSTAYRDTSLFQDRIISEHPLPAVEYDVYSAALREFPPDKTPAHDWITVTGVTIRAEKVEADAFRDLDVSLSDEMLSRLHSAGDTVYLIGSHFAESLNVAISPVLDSTDWVPIQWHRVRDRPHFWGLVSLSRVAFDNSHETAVVYGLWGTGTLGTGYPRLVLLRKQAGSWKVVTSHAPED